MTTAPASAEARARRIVWTALGVTLAAVITAGVWQLRSSTGTPVDLPVYGTVPPFTLVERSGRSVAASDLAGRVWIADFIFTRCGGTCPALTTTLAALLRRLPPSTTAVSFTVDPVRDDPETLRRYAERFGADERWLFLTGDQQAVERLVRDGFRLSIAELPPGERERSPEPITHSDRFVLVDSQLRIRGYYHGTDPDGVAKLERDLAQLMNRRS
jgi:cytochrome oxidase Cu insertion factor (SCO1/SenC/PrrC family)